MAKGCFLAWSNPLSDETDAAFNEWYEGTHIPQVRAVIPSITAFHRYRTADLPTGMQPGFRYLTVYELDTDDVAAAMAALVEAGREGRLDTTDTMDPAQPGTLQWYQSLG